VRNAATTVQNVVTYTVVVGVDNSDLRLKPGMTANVTFVVAKKDDALKVPTAALRFKPKGEEERGQKPEARQKKGGERRIYVLKAGKPAPVVITTGIGNDRETEVTGGELPPDAEVVIEALGGGKKPTGPAAGPMGPRF
jgi:HlyD family secretion protein